MPCIELVGKDDPICEEEASKWCVKWMAGERRNVRQPESHEKVSDTCYELGDEADSFGLDEYEDADEPADEFE